MKDYELEKIVRNYLGLMHVPAAECSRQQYSAELDGVGG